HELEFDLYSSFHFFINIPFFGGQNDQDIKRSFCYIYIYIYIYIICHTVTYSLGIYPRDTKTIKLFYD
ncbi:MAG: hypothetical protein MCS20_01965, partial [Candidatus Phytoplasma mali]|nr:hypothetical protein [Candidatus Phytoplasma australiense]MCG7202156.1 hypothetical protein [Candidatus Phytoplasma mali]